MDPSQNPSLPAGNAPFPVPGKWWENQQHMGGYVQSPGPYQGQHQPLHQTPHLSQYHGGYHGANQGAYQAAYRDPHQVPPQLQQQAAYLGPYQGTHQGPNLIHQQGLYQTHQRPPQIPQLAPYQMPPQGPRQIPHRRATQRVLDNFSQHLPQQFSQQIPVQLPEQLPPQPPFVSRPSHPPGPANGSSVQQVSSQQRQEELDSVFPRVYTPLPQRWGTNGVIPDKVKLWIQRQRAEYHAPPLQEPPVVDEVVYTPATSVHEKQEHDHGPRTPVNGPGEIQERHIPPGINETVKSSRSSTKGRGRDSKRSRINGAGAIRKPQKSKGETLILKLPSKKKSSSKAVPGDREGDKRDDVFNQNRDQGTYFKGNGIDNGTPISKQKSVNGMNDTGSRSGHIIKLARRKAIVTKHSSAPGFGTLGVPERETYLGEFEPTKGCSVPEQSLVPSTTASTPASQWTWKTDITRTTQGLPVMVSKKDANRCIVTDPGFAPIVTPPPTEKDESEDPLLMLLRAAEMILGPLIPRGMSSDLTGTSGEKLMTRSQKALPLLTCPQIPNVMTAIEPYHPGKPNGSGSPHHYRPGRFTGVEDANADAGERLRLPSLAEKPCDKEILRLPSLAEMLRDVDLGGRNPSSFDIGTGRTQVDSPLDISHFRILKRKPESCTMATGLDGNKYQYEKRFNIFEEFLKRPELTLFLAKHLRVQELLILYRISKQFHNIVNARFTTVIKAQAQLRAAESAKIFPPRCYAKLCIPDPGFRPHPVAARAVRGEARKVPSFRWLLMVCFREMVCHEIITILAEDGVPVPDRCASTMKKIWFLMDIPDNARRIGLVQNPEIFTDADLFFATLFFVKLDMRFTDPVTGSGKDGMRRLLLSQPSLSMLWRALKRTALISKLDVMKLFARWKYQPRPDQRGMSIFGIPPNEIGIVQYEGWGRTGSRVLLQRPDELLLKESIRRGLELQQRYTDMFLWGYINPATLQNYPPVLRQRELERLEGLEELLIPVEDRGKEEVGKMVSKMVRG
ncbi:hypothetical protein AJ79_04612 [Helicocarpus griseus UAMH5409]|uniref:Uncharacterized protein n=1 Tax=Helicocarpus griseus UAMH5409 TaxID=1447875 RepID=A0A2B7XSF8_9EURO|nr:hypothetical protein AJ79_04612 [Helicocarpus griseus UAMH5409]